MGIVAVVDASRHFGVETFVAGDGQQVGALDIEAAVGESGRGDPFERECPAKLEVLEAQVGSAFEEARRNLVVDGVFGVRNRAVGVVDRPGVDHFGDDDRFRAVALEAMALLVVDLAAGDALEEDLEVEGLVVGSEVDAVVDGGYRRADKFFRKLVNLYLPIERG